MTKRLKVASAAALLMSVAAAMSASDSTHAAGAGGTIEMTGSAAITLPALAAEGAAPIHSSAPVSFAAPQPVVQPLTVQPDAADSLAALVARRASPGALDAEMRCLAGAVYFEAKSESFEGQLAVARVIINRRDSGRFADSLCGVVYQPSQFSFVRGRSMPSIDTGSRDWQEAVAVARIALDDAWESPADEALYFHARRVSPGWGKPRLTAIGNHVFYK